LGRGRYALEVGASCLVYALIITGVTLVVILVFTQQIHTAVLYLSYGLLLEGGGALISGGAAASFSPVIGKLGESVFHSASWDAKRVREAEKQARVWIVTGAFLFAFGLLVSSL